MSRPKPNGWRRHGSEEISVAHGASRVVHRAVHDWTMTQRGYSTDSARIELRWLAVGRYDGRRFTPLAA